MLGDSNQFDETISGSFSDYQDVSICYDNYDSFANNSQENPDTPAVQGSANTGDDVSLHSYSYAEQAMLTLTMTVRADNPVGITFAGYDHGLIDITSNATVNLDGTLTNPNGDPEPSPSPESGSIVQPSSESSILARVALPDHGRQRRDRHAATLILTDQHHRSSATGNIGSSNGPISASMTPGGVLNATSGPGGIFLSLGTGAGIGSVAAGTSGNYGDVNISATGSLLNSGVGTNVSGRSITLTTTIGTVGTIATPLVIAAHATPLGPTAASTTASSTSRRSATSA